MEITKEAHNFGYIQGAGWDVDTWLVSHDVMKVHGCSQPQPSTGHKGHHRDPETFCELWEGVVDEEVAVLWLTEDTFRKCIGNKIMEVIYFSGQESCVRSFKFEYNCVPLSVNHRQ